MTAGPQRIGPWLATFVVANNMIGSGFFLLPATLAQSGSVTTLSWIVTTALAMVLGAAFARLARTHPTMDCADDYVRPSLGRDAGFLATALYWIASWLGNNAIAVAAVGYLATLLPDAVNTPSAQVWGQVILIWFTLAMNLLGPRRVAQFQSACLLLGLAPVAAVLLGGWSHFSPETYVAAWNTTERSDFQVVMSSLAPVFWAFVGLECGAMVAGIVRDPDRNVPIATIGGVLIASVVYISSSILVMGIVPATVLAASNAPFAEVVGRIWGPEAAIIIAIAAGLKATGTLGGWMLVAGEAGARAAQRGFLPAWFGRMLPNGSAHLSLLFVGVVMTFIAFLTLAPTAAQQFGTLINWVVLLIVLAYAAAGLTLLVGSPERPSGPGDRLLGIGALAACALLVFTSPWSMILGALAVAAVSWVLFRLLARQPDAPGKG